MDASLQSRNNAPIAKRSPLIFANFSIIDCHESLFIIFSFINSVFCSAIVSIFS